MAGVNALRCPAASFVGRLILAADNGRLAGVMSLRSLRLCTPRDENQGKAFMNYAALAGILFGRRSSAVYFKTARYHGRTCFSKISRAAEGGR